MNRQGKTFLVVLSLLVSALALQGVGLQPEFETTSYYLLSMGALQPDLDNLADLARGMDLSVIVYEQEGASVTPGTTAPHDLLLLQAADDVLIIDSERFHLRRAMEQLLFTVRPTEEGYELVINPLVDVAIGDALAVVLEELQGMGLLGSDVSLEYQAFSKGDLKGPAPPDGVPIDSTFYGLVIAENWFVHATVKGLRQTGLRVEAVAEKLPGQSLTTPFAEFIVEESDGLAKLLLPIDLLLPLARSSAVGYVRPPYQPSVP